MKRLLFWLTFSVFPITAIIYHLWTAIIGFSEGGFLGGLLTLFLPVLSEIYWFFKMLGENEAYTIVAIIHAILAFFYIILGNANR